MTDLKEIQARLSRRIALVGDMRALFEEIARLQDRERQSQQIAANLVTRAERAEAERDAYKETQMHPVDLAAFEGMRAERDEALKTLAMLPGCDNPRSPQDVLDLLAALDQARGERNQAGAEAQAAKAHWEAHWEALRETVKQFKVTTAALAQTVDQRDAATAEGAVLRERIHAIANQVGSYLQGASRRQLDDVEALLRAALRPATEPRTENDK